MLFQGGASFGDSVLMPSVSGSATAPISFGSYGPGQAQISNAEGAVWLPPGEHDLTFENLDLSSSGAIVFASSSSGAGVSGITLENSVVHDSPYAGLESQPQDSNWTIQGNTFRHTGDSGLLVMGSQTTITGNTITDTGWNASLSYGKHGIYAKGPNMTITNNNISDQTNGSAISIRYAGARVIGNQLHDTAYGVSFFPQDPSNSGLDVIAYNRMWNISGFAFYYAGTTDLASGANQPSGIDAVFASNTAELSSPSAEGVDVSEISAAHVWVANNVFTGTYGSAYQGCSTCAENNNDWYGATTNIPSGAGDLYVDPALSAAPALTLPAGSPLAHAGTTNIPNLTYTSTCTGLPFAYCGSAPEIGAVALAG